MLDFKYIRDQKDLSQKYRGATKNLKYLICGLIMKKNSRLKLVSLKIFEKLKKFYIRTKTYDLEQLIK